MTVMTQVIGLLAQAPTTPPPRSFFDLPVTSIPQALLAVLLFGILGIILTAFGFKVFDWIMPKIHVETELHERQNMAVAIVMAAVIIGISIVIAAAVGS